MRSWVFDVAALVLFLVLGFAGLWAAGEIKGISFDPLGSAAAPYAIGGGVILLSVLSGLAAFKDRRKAEGSGMAEDAAELREKRYSAREISDVLIMLLLIVAYVFCLFNLRIPFSLATLAFVPAVACLLDRSWRTRTLPIALAAGAVIGVGGELLFTKVFFVDLPTLW